MAEKALEMEDLVDSGQMEWVGRVERAREWVEMEEAVDSGME
jgi:hypothetical protein